MFRSLFRSSSGGSYVWCACTRAHAHTHTRTKRYAAASPQLNFYIFNIFLNSVTLTRNIRAPWRWFE